MNIFVHSTNSLIDGDVITTMKELEKAIFAKYKKEEFYRTHFDILDYDTYKTVADIYYMWHYVDFIACGDTKKDAENILNELESMLYEYSRYLPSYDEMELAYFKLDHYIKGRH